MYCPQSSFNDGLVIEERPNKTIPEWEIILRDQSDENADGVNILEGTGSLFLKNKDIVNILKLADIQYRKRSELNVEIDNLELSRKKARATLTDFYQRVLDRENRNIAQLVNKYENVFKIEEIINGFKYLDDTRKQNLIMAYQSANNTRELYQQARKQKHIKIDYNEIVMKFEALELSIEDRKAFENAGKR